MSANHDKNVSPNWKPVAGLKGRKPKMDWSDRIFYWLISLAGLAIVGVGVAVLAIVHWGRLGGCLIGVGFVIFLFGSPGQAVRNGYRSM
jgi:hypothetical protein